MLPLRAPAPPLCGPPASAQPLRGRAARLSLPRPEPPRRAQLAQQVVNLGMILSSALIIWKSLILFTASESPVVVVLRCARPRPRGPPRPARSLTGGDPAQR